MVCTKDASSTKAGWSSSLTSLGQQVVLMNGSVRSSILISLHNLEPFQSIESSSSLHSMNTWMKIAVTIIKAIIDFIKKCITLSISCGKHLAESTTWSRSTSTGFVCMAFIIIKAQIRFIIAFRTYEYSLYRTIQLHLLIFSWSDWRKIPFQVCWGIYSITFFRDYGVNKKRKNNIFLSVYILF